MVVHILAVLVFKWIIAFYANEACYKKAAKNLFAA